MAIVTQLYYNILILWDHRRLPKRRYAALTCPLLRVLCVLTVVTKVEIVLCLSLYDSQTAVKHCS